MKKWIKTFDEKFVINMDNVIYFYTASRENLSEYYIRARVRDGTMELAKFTDKEKRDEAFRALLQALSEDGQVVTLPCGRNNMEEAEDAIGNENDKSR